MAESVYPCGINRMSAWLTGSLSRCCLSHSHLICSVTVIYSLSKIIEDVGVLSFTLVFILSGIYVGLYVKSWHFFNELTGRTQLFDTASQISICWMSNFPLNLPTLLIGNAEIPQHFQLVQCAQVVKWISLLASAALAKLTRVHCINVCHE